MDRRKIFVNILDNGLIETVFQPIFHVNEKYVIGYEALSRGPVGPLHSPTELFSCAAEFGYLLELEKICLAKVQEHVAAMPPDLILFINISPLAIEQDLLSMGFGRKGIVAEITEVGVIRDYNKMRSIINFHRSTDGLKIAIDDVGAGYDRLRCIAELEPDFIKIDRGLIENCYLYPGKRKVLKHLVALSAEVKAQVIAEGIEQSNELIAVNMLGIQYAQGYYLGLPGVNIVKGAARSKTS